LAQTPPSLAISHFPPRTCWRLYRANQTKKWRHRVPSYLPSSYCLWEIKPC
jgi:hypothetical protein